MTQKIRVVARVVAYPETIDHVKQVLSQLIEPTRQEAGCLQYELLQNQADPMDFTFVEIWESSEALEQHLASSHLINARQQLEGLIAVEPDIRCYDLIL